MKLYKNLYEDFDQLFLGYSTIGIILSSCLGSAAAMVVLMNGHNLSQMIQLFLIVVVAMGYNSAFLAQMKHKFVFNSLILSLATSSILLLINVAMRYL